MRKTVLKIIFPARNTFRRRIKDTDDNEWIRCNLTIQLCRTNKEKEIFFIQKLFVIFFPYKFIGFDFISICLFQTMPIKRTDFPIL